ncbi:hypothetical protein [Streptomyces sp. NPDC002324]
MPDGRREDLATEGVRTIGHNRGFHHGGAVPENAWATSPFS